MAERIAPDKAPLIDAVSAEWITRWSRRLTVSLFKRLKTGQITLVEDHQETVFGAPSSAFPQCVRIIVHDARFFRLAAAGGSVGAAEAYMLGYWSTNDLTAVVRIITRNHAVFSRLEKGWARVMDPAGSAG